MPTRLPWNKCLYEPTLSNPVLTEASQPETNTTIINIVDAFVNRIFLPFVMKHTSFHQTVEECFLCLASPYYTLELSYGNLSLKTNFNNNSMQDNNCSDRIDYL
jgi:hypothetical protein